MNSEVEATIPPHVATNMVFAYDPVQGPEVMAFPPAALDGIREQRAAFYSGLYGGFWVFTRFLDIRAIFQDNEHFKQDMSGLPPAPFTRVLIPLKMDHPEHLAYRRILMPVFTPKHMARIEPTVRRAARERIATFAPNGRAEFASQFSLALASSMFCGMLDLPLSDFSLFHSMSFDLIYGVSKVWTEQGAEAGKTMRVRMLAEIEALMRSWVMRRAAALGDDVPSMLLGSKVFGRPVTEEEEINMATLLFYAGTDSTAGAVSYAHAFLAQHPTHRQQIIDHIDDEDYLWNASEELLRFHGFHHISRIVSMDCEVAGVFLKKGDRVALPLGCGNRDDSEFGDPYTVDFERQHAKRHPTFGAGAHRCIGSHLATLELRTALQEVHRAIPDYRLAAPVQYVGGGKKIVPERIEFTFTPVSFVA